MYMYMLTVTCNSDDIKLTESIETHTNNYVMHDLRGGSAKAFKISQKTMNISIPSLDVN